MRHLLTVKRSAWHPSLFDTRSTYLQTCPQALVEVQARAQTEHSTVCHLVTLARLSDESLEILVDFNLTKGKAASFPTDAYSTLFSIVCDMTSLYFLSGNPDIVFYFIIPFSERIIAFYPTGQKLRDSGSKAHYSDLSSSITRFPVELPVPNYARLW